uniref:Secreted protein n=1 Tax=Anguilla anguilla TaxID=7936 RepID=A0A0E9XPM8_ANGAN
MNFFSFFFSFGVSRLLVFISFSPCAERLQVAWQQTCGDWVRFKKKIKKKKKGLRLKSKISLYACQVNVSSRLVEGKPAFPSLSFWLLRSFTKTIFKFFLSAIESGFDSVKLITVSYVYAGGHPPSLWKLIPLVSWANC